MMSNLFSVFDPVTGIAGLSFNWLSSGVGLILFPVSYWLVPSRFIMLFKSISWTLYSEFKTLLGPAFNPGMPMLFVALFLYTVCNNFLGLFPYIFTSTSHLSFTLVMSLPMWLAFMVYGWLNNTQHMFAHLVPQGTPGVLMPFMVCIETISNVIRPGTLAVRLTANMIAGHLLMTLMGNTGPSLSYMLLSILVAGQMCLLILESAVSIIQGYVFAVLSTLYSSEV